MPGPSEIVPLADVSDVAPEQAEVRPLLPESEVDEARAKICCCNNLRALVASSLGDSSAKDCVPGELGAASAAVREAAPVGFEKRNVGDADDNPASVKVSPDDAREANADPDFRRGLAFPLSSANREAAGRLA